MSPETPSSMSYPDPSQVSELPERELLFNAYLDGDLSEEDERAFDERLDEDPEFREAWGEFAEVIGQVQNLPYEFAPDDFTSRVRSRIRTRSRGRFFGDSMLQRQRAPYEVIAVVMIIVMASAYLFMGIPPDRGLDSEGDKELEIPHYTAPASPQDEP